MNNAGGQYPRIMPACGGGAGTIENVATDCVQGRCLSYTLTPFLKADGSIDPRDGSAGSSATCIERERRSQFYTDFNSHNANGTRGFTREYVTGPGQWQFNTFNRLTLWLKVSRLAEPLRTGGQENFQLGTYVKRVANADMRSDETGGNHYYHFFNVPPEDVWVKLVMNTHPNHQRGGSGNQEWGNMPHPTGEAAYNYFDAMTRFYLSQQDSQYPTMFPAQYAIDEVQFYREEATENDEQVYSIAAAVTPDNRVILTWNRLKTEDSVKHEVRYAFSSIHQLGWDKATPAPDGIVTPPGSRGYNGMLYQTAGINLAGRTHIYLAIKPENSNLFSEIELPLTPR